MLTKNDLQAIRTIVKQEVITNVDTALVPIEKDLKSINTRLRKVEKTVDTMAKVLDRADVDLHKRVKRIENHLELPTLPAS